MKRAPFFTKLLLPKRSGSSRFAARGGVVPLALLVVAMLASAGFVFFKTQQSVIGPRPASMRAHMGTNGFEQTENASVEGRERSFFPSNQEPSAVPAAPAAQSQSRLDSAERQQEAAEQGPNKITPFQPVTAARLARRLLSQAADSPFTPSTYFSALTALASGDQRVVSQGGGSGQRSGTRANRSSAEELPSATVGQTYCRSLVGSSSTALVAVRQTSGVPPTGLAVNQSSGMLCGIPREPGIFRFGLQFQFSLDYASEKQFRLVVAEEQAVTDGELGIVTDELTTGQLGKEYVVSLQATGGEQPYAWSVSGLGDEFEIDAATGVLAGTPIDSGEFLVSVTVRDALGTRQSATLTLLIRETPLFIITPSVVGGVANEAYQTRFAAQGGTPPYTWELLTALPAGLEFDSGAGVLSGTPVEAVEEQLLVTVSDSDGTTDTAEFPFSIRAGTLAIESDGLQDAFAGIEYRFVLTASGGQAPYSWTASGLPAGLVIADSGSVVGYPERGGESTVVLTVRDAQALTASKQLRLRVQARTDDTDDTTDNFPPVFTPPVISNPGANNGSGNGAANGIGNGNGNGNGGPTLAVPTRFEAVASDRKVGLSWRNPLQTGFLRIILVRGIDAVPSTAEPQDSSEGEIVYAGTEQTYLDQTAANGIVYGYAAFAQYAGTAIFSEPVFSALVSPSDLSLVAAPDPFADGVVQFNPLDTQCFGCASMPRVVLGPPQGGGDFSGSADVASLGAAVAGAQNAALRSGGSITLEFTDNIVVDGPGPDFTVFENAIRQPGTDFYFLEPAVIEVSTDGELFYRFAFDFVPHFNPDGSLNLFNPFCYASGFAGVKPVYSNAAVTGAPQPTNPNVSGGDQFDLADLPGRPLLWIRFIRIISTGDNWLLDAQGETVRHTNSSPTFGASGRGNSGFDLDAVTALNY